MKKFFHLEYLVIASGLACGVVTAVPQNSIRIADQ